MGCQKRHKSSPKQRTILCCFANRTAFASLSVVCLTKTEVQSSLDWMTECLPGLKQEATRKTENGSVLFDIILGLGHSPKRKAA